MERFPTLTARPALFPTALTILKALVLARWLAWAWMVGIVAFSADALRHPGVAWLAVAVTFLVTAVSSALVRTQPERLLHLPFVAADVGLAVGLSIVDGYVFEPGHVFETTQSIATQWPLLAMATAGVAFGPLVAALMGLAVGPAEWAGAVLNDYPDFDTRHIVSFVATSLFFAACGAVFGWQAGLLKRVEGEIADRRARDEVGRVLHDTVLQTLALVERRAAATDPELAAAAREADRDLRSFLFGAVGTRPADLETRVRAEVDRVRRTLGDTETSVSVSVLDDGCRLPADHQEMVARAIGESVANALEHAAASRIVVFVETDDDGHVFASVADDGVGFDPDDLRAGHGLDESVIGRIEAIGGRVRIDSSSAGTEVLVWSHRDPEDATEPVGG